jgi:hypothetical protein
MNQRAALYKEMAVREKVFRKLRPGAVAGPYAESGGGVRPPHRRAPLKRRANDAGILNQDGRKLNRY